MLRVAAVLKRQFRDLIMRARGKGWRKKRGYDKKSRT